MLDENSLRKPEFQAESNPVVLDDGQTWYLPKPAVCLRPQFVGGKSKDLAARTTFGPEFDAAVDAFDAILDQDEFSMVAYVNEVMNIGACLLLRNYDLTDGQLCSLFAWHGPECEKSKAMLEAVVSTARGRGPKAIGGGSD